MVSITDTSNSVFVLESENATTVSYLLNHILELEHINSVSVQFQGRARLPEQLNRRYHFAVTDTGLTLTMSGRVYAIPYGSGITMAHLFDRAPISVDPTSPISRIGIRLANPADGALASLSIYF